MTDDLSLDPALADLPRDPHSEEADVRLGAVHALARAADPTAVLELLQILQDESEVVAVAAAEALGHIGSPAAVPAVPGLVQALRDDTLSYAAEKALIEIGDAAVPGLAQALHDEYWAVREAAIDALEHIGTPAALEALRQWQSRQSAG